MTLNSDGAGRETEKRERAPRKSLWTNREPLKSKKSMDTFQLTGTLNAKFEPIGNEGEQIEKLRGTLEEVI